MAKDPYADDIARLSTAKRTHFTHFMVPKMPWHTDDHKFGEGSDKGDDEGLQSADNSLTPRTTEDGVLSAVECSLVTEGDCYYCGEPAVYSCGERLYCPECFGGLQEDREDPYA
jgi:hypothetical protein